MTRTQKLAAALLTLVVGCGQATAPADAELGGQQAALQSSRSSTSPTTPPFGSGTGGGPSVPVPSRPTVNPGRPIPISPEQPGRPSVPAPQLPGTLPGTPLPTPFPTPAPSRPGSGSIAGLGGASPASFSSPQQCAARGLEQLNSAGSKQQAQRIGNVMSRGLRAESVLRPMGQVGWLRQKYGLDELLPKMKLVTPPVLEGTSECTGGAQKHACYGLLARALTDNGQASLMTSPGVVAAGLSDWNAQQREEAAQAGTQAVLPGTPSIGELEAWGQEFPEAAQTLEPGVNLDSATQIVGKIDALLAFGNFAEAAKLLVTLEKINPSAASAVKCLVGHMGGLSMLADRVRRGETLEPTLGRPVRPTLDPQDNVGPISGIVYAERHDGSRETPAAALAPLVFNPVGAALFLGGTVVVLGTLAIAESHPHVGAKLGKALREIGGGINMGAGDEPPEPRDHDGDDSDVQKEVLKQLKDQVKDKVKDCVANLILGQSCLDEIGEDPKGGKSGETPRQGADPRHDGAGPHIDDPDVDPFSEERIGFKPEDAAPIRNDRTSPEGVSSAQMARDNELKRRLMGFMQELSIVHVDTAQVEARMTTRSCGLAMLQSTRVEELWTRYTDEHYEALVNRMRPVDYTKPNWAERVRPQAVNAHCGVRDPVEPLP